MTFLLPLASKIEKSYHFYLYIKQKSGGKYYNEHQKIVSEHWP